jgi:hypothetical protein
VRTETLTIRTGGRPVVRDITAECASFVDGAGDGLLHVFVPHATAGLAVIETGAGSDEDLLAALDALLPADDRWRHLPAAEPGPPAGGARDQISYEEPAAASSVGPPNAAAASAPIGAASVHGGTWVTSSRPTAAFAA